MERILWAIFWTGAALSSAVVLGFLWAAVPVLVFVLRGGWARLWFFDGTGYVVFGAFAYLGVAAVILVRRRRKVSP